MQKRLEPKYRIDPRLVGSARYNAVVCDDNGVYDMDYQLILTCNCKCFDADIVRKDFFVAFNAIKNANEKVENSTSVITARMSDNSGKFTADNERFSFDFAIVMEDNAVSYLTRRSQDNKYVWNRLPNRNSCTYQRFLSLDYCPCSKTTPKALPIHNRSNTAIYTINNQTNSNDSEKNPPKKSSIGVNVHYGIVPTISVKV